jgi:signal transduction histidine kinase
MRLPCMVATHSDLLMKSSKRILYSRIIFIAGIVLLTVLSIIFLYETHQESSSSTVAYNKNIVRQSLTKIFLTLKDKESGFRGYALTLDSSYLYTSLSRDSLQAQFDIIDSLISGHDQQLRNLDKLKRLFSKSIQSQDSVADAREIQGYFKSQRFYTDLRRESMRMDTISDLIDNMRNIESQVSEDKALDARKHTVVATMVGVTVSMFSIIVFVIAFYFIDQELKRSQKYIDETETLNKKVAEINFELEEANRALHKLNAELEVKNFQMEKYASELSSFTHITSHDMQEPLRKIEFFVSVVEERELENLSDEGRKFLEKIRQSVNRMRQLFLSLLDFSLANTIDKDFEEVDLNEILQGTVKSLKVYIKDTHALIDSDRLPTIRGITYQLMQLFENVVSNAIKFRRNDVVPQIKISYEVIYPGSHSVRGLRLDARYHKISFEDNGIGFDPNHAEKIFGIFQRLIGKNESFGVGIGLAISRKIAENHGGILVADSKPNVGSIFTLYIPIV